MNYRNQPGFATVDWRDVNFNLTYSATIVHVIGDNREDLERLGAPEEPEIEAPIEPDEPDEDADSEEIARYDVAMRKYLHEQGAYDLAWAKYEADREEFENVQGQWCRFSNSSRSASYSAPARS